ncbi:MAG: hypothetical protein U0798_01455 [Gemmataceae bacterium]
MAADIEDTYAEAFRSLYTSILVTASDRYWLEHAIRERRQCRSSIPLRLRRLDLHVDPTIRRTVGPGRFCVSRPAVLERNGEQRLERAVSGPHSQNILTRFDDRLLNVLPAETNWFPRPKSVVLRRWPSIQG